MHKRSNHHELPSWMGATIMAVILVASASACSGKKRPFASGSVIDETTSETRPDGTDGRESSSDPLADEDGEGSSESQAGQESEAVPGSFIGPTDGGSDEATLSTSMAVCGDACSGECAPGATECASLTERIECGIDARWGQPVTCENVCLDGACAGECPPGVSECLSTTRFRSCSELGTWSEPADCENACVGTACGGECTPGETRCSSTTSVQTCDDQGQWGQTTGCQNACAGNACTGECMPGATRCSSETLLQRCNDQGQFLAPTACQFACVNGGCGGECSPGSRRCNPANGVPQFCSSTGIWQSQSPCPFVCSGSGSCSGECTPGSRRCSPASGVPQLCSTAGFWQNQAACQFVCTGSGACGGECTPGSRRCDPASGVPQLCSNAGAWQNQAACARGCQSGSCIPQLGPGLACGSARDCTSGFCVDGVCCQSQCGGVCAQCEAGTGACITPATDPDCDPVVCSSNECRVSSGNITSNLCRARGQCKDQGDCNFTALVAGTPCDVATSSRSLCDGQGNCTDPIVQCGSVSCEIETDTSVGTETWCCGRQDASSVQSFSCGPRAECGFNFQAQIPGSNPAACDDPSDCRTGLTCCFASFSNGSDISCRATCNNRISNPGGGGTNRQLCQSPVFSGPCPNGAPCNVTSPRFPGWAFCAVP
jgi:hypothetical protein